MQRRNDLDITILTSTGSSFGCSIRTTIARRVSPRVLFFLVSTFSCPKLPLCFSSSCFFPFLYSLLFSPLSLPSSRQTLMPTLCNPILSKFHLNWIRYP